jgi:hypothetical protein
VTEKRPSPTPQPTSIQIAATRRTVITMLLAAAGWTAGLSRSLAAKVLNLTIQPSSSVADAFSAATAGQRLRTRVIRPDDFIYLDVEYENIGFDGDPAKKLLRLNPGRQALLIVNHQPQAIADQAYQQVSATEASTMPDSTGQPYSSPAGSEPAPSPPQVAGVRMAQPSRVAFIMPPDVSSIPFTLPALVKAFRTWAMNLDYQAAPDPRLPTISFSRAAIAAVLKDQFDQIAASATKGVSAADRPLVAGALQKTYASIASRLASGQSLQSGAINALIGQEFQRNLRASGSSSTLLQRLGSKPLVIGPIGPRNNGILRNPGTAVLAPNFQRAPGPPHEPADTVTAIEFPYRLIQSPLATAGWYHSDEPQRHSGLTEIWHTRLGTRKDDRIDDTSPEPLRAIWSPDYPQPEPTGFPFTMSLDGRDRQMLVELTAGYDQLSGRRPYQPTPATARRLMLSALGGWLLEDGDWPAGTGPADVDLTQWNHRAAMARDYYVRVVYAGYLFPLGHAASLVKVTERKFENQPGGGRVALLRQRFFIIVRQKTKIYPGVNQANDGRDFPFSRVDILTVTTPNLAAPGSSPADRIPDPSFYGGRPVREAFWPVTTGTLPGSLKDFMFQAVGYDQAGSTIPFTTPLLFISINRNNSGDLDKIITAYKQVTDQTRRKRPFNGAVIQFAPNIGVDAGDTNTPTLAITFIGKKPVGDSVPATADDPLPAQFYPGTESIDLKLSAVQRLLGTDKPVTATVADTYLNNALDASANPGQVFLSLIGASGTLLPGAATDKGGGLVTPNIFPTALSRTFGPVAGANNAEAFVNGAFNPKDFLGSDLKLFGIVPLGDILADVLELQKAPQLVNQELPDRVETRFALHQEDLKPYALPGLPDNPIFVPNADGVPSALDVTSVATVERNGAAPAGPPTTTVDGNINNFKINLFGCIILTFDKLSFSSRPGKKPDVTVGLNQAHGVLFGGPLEFVNKLKDYIPANGFTDPPNMSVTAAGISASYSLALPSITLGVLTLQNISIGAGFNLPFDGDSPGAKFNFADRHNPFNLTVSLLGGGGFFAIAVSAAGVDEIEAQLEFGAFAALNIGVASGSVYVKGGFYFHWQGATHSVDLEAFVELGGHLSVLGLISVTLTFHVDLAYESDGSHSSLVGQATLTVDIDILFFSKSVSLSVEKRFAGSDADPKFIDFIPNAGIWQNYCSAFG